MAEQDINKIFKNAQAAFNLISDISIAGRISLLKKLEGVLLSQIDEVVAIVCEETGKVKSEALISDFFVSLEALSYYINNLESILSEKHIKTPLMFFNTYGSVEYRPSGVAFIIAPWNFPFQLAFLPVITALSAGCSVVLKPSEVTPKTGKLIENIIKKAGFPEHSVQCVFGGADVVNKAIDCKPARLFFTGSTPAGIAIGKRCAELLIPALLELGGKAPAIVFEDADIERTANGIIYSAFANNGQICVATTRLLLAEGIYDKFVSVLLDNVKEIKLNRDYGPLMKKERCPYLNELVKDALKNGAKILYQGADSACYDAPVILGDVTKEMRIFQEECFAPILCITSFKTESAALELANNTDYGLSASIWSKDIIKAKKFAQKIKAGHISINDAIKGVGIASMPFGGVKNSGIGRYHSSEGIYFFSDTISYLVNKSKRKKEINWFGYDLSLYKNFKTLINILYRKRFFSRESIEALIYFIKRGKR